MENTDFIIEDLGITPEQRRNYNHFMEFGSAEGHYPLFKEQLSKIPDIIDGNKLSRYEKMDLAMGGLDLTNSGLFYELRENKILKIDLNDDSEKFLTKNNIIFNNLNPNSMETQKEFDQVDYLKNQLKYLGFGEGSTLHKDLEKGIHSKKQQFEIKTTSDKALPGNKVDFTLKFNKTESGGVFLNSYNAKLTNEKNEEISHNFPVNRENTFTAKEVVNLLEGRSVKIEFHNPKRGNAKRPFIVVPNDSILKQWVETIFETIPDAKVNVLGNLGKDFDLSKFDNKDGEITIVTYEGFNNIGFSEAITQNLASQFNYISESEMKGVTNTERDIQLEFQKDKEVEGRMKRGKIYDWEDFGFDHLTYDEVHNANHIVGKVKIEDRRFSSDFRSQNQQTSKLGINTWMAAQYIQDKNDGRNVTLLSATPFTNKPLEYYSILSLIANKRLEESGYFNVNTFFETFMEADNNMEIDAKGDVKFKANVRRFKNNSLFQQLLSEFIDVKGEENNPELKRPNKINKEYKIEQNDLSKEQYDLLNESFNDTQKGAILTHILNARLIAISPYLSPYYEDEEPSVKEFVENSPKLKQTMDLIHQNKKDIPDSGQIIYSELAVAQFPKLKEYLITEIGYKPREIGIITGATNKNQRVSVQNDFNDGKIKVVIGSEAIQEGMNLQENTTDVYMLSLPYNFTSLRQVEGRAWRQGNKNENVRVNFMLTNDSIDVFMLQKLQAKQAWYLEAMKKGADVLDISDISTQELKTSIITNPETRANIEIELIKKKIESKKNKFLADSAFVLRKYEDFIKVKEEVTKAEHGYNRILGYSKDEADGNSDYWKNQLPFHQKTIDLAKEMVQEKIKELAEKGVNVTEIEQQTKSTEGKIIELDKKLEELPDVRENLVAQYKIEKERQLKANENRDYIGERAIENRSFFKSSEIIEGKRNFEPENLIASELSFGANTNPEQSLSAGRRR